MSCLCFSPSFPFTKVALVFVFSSNLFRIFRLSISFLSPFLSPHLPFSSFFQNLFLSGILVYVVFSCYCHTASL